MRGVFRLIDPAHPDVPLRLRELRSTLREALWFLPTLAGLASFGAGLGLTVLGDTPALPDLLLFSGDGGDARGLLGSLLAALLTALALVLSLSVIALQTASTQFSPRVLRTFVRDLGTQVVISTLVGASTYLLAVLVALRTGDGEEVPRLALTVGLLTILGSLAAITFFFHSISQAIRVESLMRAVVHDVEVHLDDRQATMLPDEPGGFPDPPSDAVLLRCGRLGGTFQDVDLARVRGLADAHDVVVRMLPMLGQHVPPNGILGWAWRRRDGSALEPQEAHAVGDGLREAVSLGFERTMRQDVAFGVRELVDMANKAMSPAINDPYTAVQAVEHITTALVLELGRDVGPLLSRDPDGRVVVAVPAPDHAFLIDLACDQVRRYGAREPAVLGALLQLLRAVAAADCEGPDLRPALHEQVRRILRASEADIENGAVRDALHEDARATARWIDGDRSPPSVGPWTL